VAGLYGIIHDEISAGKLPGLAVLLNFPALF
jgi:hypothetical protein